MNKINLIILGTTCLIIINCNDKHKNLDTKMNSISVYSEQGIQNIDTSQIDIKQCEPDPCPSHAKATYPNSIYRSIEEVSETESTNLTALVFNSFILIDTNRVKDSKYNPNASGKGRFITRLCKTDLCGCPISTYQPYKVFVGLDKFNKPLLGNTNILARPCPPHCYGGSKTK